MFQKKKKVICILSVVEPRERSAQHVQLQSKLKDRDLYYREKNHMLISIDVAPIYDFKNFQQSGNRGKISKHNNGKRVKMEEE